MCDTSGALTLLDLLCLFDVLRCMQQLLVGNKPRSCSDPVHCGAPVQDSTSTELEMAKLEQLCSECDVLVSRKPKATFNGKDVKSSFETLLKDKSSLQHEYILERPLACSALAGVLKFSEIASDSDNHGACIRHAYIMNTR